MMGKNWSKGTHPLDSEQRHISIPHQEDTQHGAASPVVEVVDSIKEAASGDEASRRFLLRVVQPGLAGLMDGSVSTLAPIFATAFATHRPFTAFLVGMAAATGAGISMAFSEALSDNGELTGRGSPVVRGAITGGMTFLGGSLHTLPFLVSNLHVALVIAYIVVAVELVAIAAIRYRFFGTKWWLSMLQVVGGGALVFAAALIFGNA
ncbi:MAG TPA: VIT1/CCC1 transporter family protein [Ktedonobacteraceae bacterium]|nr:VIT1/CCC1 transporter family protein [Ktedonobacteraceae bacterium]